jgi:hypothetical protein
MSKGSLAIVVSFTGLAVAVPIALLGSLTLLPQYGPRWPASLVVACLLCAGFQLFAIRIGLSTWEEPLGKIAVLLATLLILGSFLMLFLR